MSSSELNVDTCDCKASGSMPPKMQLLRERAAMRGKQSSLGSPSGSFDDHWRVTIIMLTMLFGCNFPSCIDMKRKYVPMVCDFPPGCGHSSSAVELQISPVDNSDDESRQPHSRSFLLPEERCNDPFSSEDPEGDFEEEKNLDEFIQCLLFLMMKVMPLLKLKNL
ncbi:hypothetical protein Nepgr_002423 [Nepenthes gracilis]|uniref:Uncharacterized protein n=1 Tax=Nepenthes gracilis TaxID=150966 RepID=A0AAD3P680_NEPGR|nr:hypothetical protein Nepgr_002423 [Nepenthes gracilis]